MVSVSKEATPRAEHETRVRSVLALFVVLGGGSLVGWAYLHPGASDAGLAAAIVSLMSGVLGWYFGSEGLEAARQEARTERERAREAEERAQLISVADSLAREKLELAWRVLRELAADQEVKPKIDVIARRLRGEAD